MNDKLIVLKENQIISEKAYEITNLAFEFLSEKLKSKYLAESDMFWTHMSMALTRIENGEPVEGPSELIVNEIKKSPFRNEIEEIISFVDLKFGIAIPQEEKDFLYLHLHRVLENNQSN